MGTPPIPEGHHKMEAWEDTDSATTKEGALPVDSRPKPDLGHQLYHHRCEPQRLGGPLPGQGSTGQMDPRRIKIQYWLELWAVHLVLQAFQHTLHQRYALVQTDSMTARAHINRQGGTRSHSLLLEATPLMTLAEKTLASLKVEYLKGVTNQETDWLSRTD